ncbi:MAG: EAL domain-containing protein [Deltaproteobacteria bacterium]|nr:EAL domain-containing protein [Deltaproteobacteria bacterium]
MADEGRGAARVLVVDDDETVRMLACASLGAAGFATEEACCGEEALAAAASRPPNLVVLDVDLPDLNGFEVCRRLRAADATRDTPILMLTGFADPDSIREAFDAGATEFEVKPPNWLILAQRLRQMRQTSAARDALRESEARLAEAQRIARLGWWEWDGAQGSLRCSEEFFPIFGLKAEEFGASFETLLLCIHPEDRDRVAREIRAAVADGRSCSLDHRIIHADGCLRFVHQEVQVRSAQRRPVRVIATIQDVTAQKESEAQIRHLAYFDGLTGLPNRRMFHERVDLALESARRHHRLAALLFLDLDRFKRINDTLGHAVGDTLLKQVADRLQECLRHTDCTTRPGQEEPDAVIARLGGDEFILLLSEIGRVQDAARVARRIFEALGQPFELASQEISVTGSIGIAIYPFDGEDGVSLLKNADTAMYHAKDQGRDNYQFYNEAMNASAFERLLLEGSLRRAVEREEFTLHYQPQVSLRTGDVVGAEALLRWNHPELGLVSPADFIPLAEETGLIVPLGEWALRAACTQAARWQAAGLARLRIAVNVSGRQFRNEEFLRVVRTTLDTSGLDPSLLDLEITETLVTGDTAAAMRILDGLKGMGLRVSVDDFGTGYSSLSYLKRLPLSALKIDRSFLKGVPAEDDPVAITAAIVSLGACRT